MSGSYNNRVLLSTLLDERLDCLHDNLMVILLLQATHYYHTHNASDSLDTHREPTPMNRIIVRDIPAIRALQSVLPHKRRLHICLSTSQPRDHLASQQPSRRTPSKDGIPLASHPMVVIGDSTRFGGTLEYHMRFGPVQRNGDQGWFALVIGKREDSRAEGQAERPCRSGCERGEDCAG